MSSQRPSHIEPIRYSCSNCPADNVRSFNAVRSLRIHNTRSHKDSPPLIIPNFTNATLCDANVSEDDLMKLFDLKSRVGVLKRIPKGARALAAKSFAQLIRNCIAFNDLASWLNLEQFAYKALHIPRQDKKDKGVNKSLVSRVKDNISSSQVPHSNELKAADFYKRIENKISDFDIKGAVRLISSDDTFAPYNEDTLNSLRAKHPPPSRILSMPTPPSPSDDHFQVTSDQVKRAISRLHSGSASGPDGSRPQFFKDLISISAGSAATEVLSAITDLCNFMLRGEVNSIACKFLYGASLCALTKKQGGIRPIAVGLSIRRLVSQLACLHAKGIIGDYFGFKQLGFGVKQGCEAAVHAVRTFVTKPENIDKVTLKIDFVNAYNSVERDVILHSVKAKTPLLYKYFWQCYASPSVLSYNSNTILSAVGSQQGDPAAAFLFPLAIQHIVDEIESKLNVWYQDDGTISDLPHIVLNDLAHLIELSNDIGLKINPSKCELFFHSGTIADEIVQKFNSLAPGIKIVSAENFNLLGAPILDEGFDNMALPIIEKVKTMFGRLENMHAHSAFFLLKNCFAIPKLNYLIRSSPAWKFNNFTDSFDNLLKVTLESILNIKLEDKILTQATLPVSFGGLGIRRLKDIALPAFISSVHGAFNIVSQIINTTDDSLFGNLNDARDSWSVLNNGFPSVPDRQKNWDTINISRIINEDLKFTDLHDIARFKALQCSESNAWLNALPSKNVGTSLDNNTFKICMALRLGAPICRPHICSCGTFVNEFGTHGLSCQKSAGRHSRHSELNRILCQALTSICFPSTLEPPGLFRNDGKRPDGLTLVPWFRGQHLVWDATCWDTLADSHVNISSKEARRTAELASRSKHSKYSELKSNNYIFNAFAVETLGSWSTEAIQLINKIGPILNSVTGDHRSHGYLIQRISLAIQRANASSMIGTLPPTTKLDQVFYL